MRGSIPSLLDDDINSIAWSNFRNNFSSVYMIFRIYVVIFWGYNWHSNVYMFFREYVIVLRGCKWYLSEIKKSDQKHMKIVKLINKLCIENVPTALSHVMCFVWNFIWVERMEILIKLVKLIKFHPNIFHMRKKGQNRCRTSRICERVFIYILCIFKKFSFCFVKL